MRLLQKNNNWLGRCFISMFSLVVAIFCSVLAQSSLSKTLEALVPSHEIHISFDIDTATLRGTSRIILPSNTPLVLYGGPLNITGIVLNRSNAGALVLQPDKDNGVHISADPQSQTLLVSWTMHIDSLPAVVGDNLISKDGITLAGFWHPIPDRDMIYTVTADLPDHFIGITEADTLTEKVSGGVKQVTGVFSHQLRAVHFMAGPYIVRSRKVSEKTTLYSYFFPEDDALADGYLEKAACYLERYEKLIGPYPYGRFSIVENRLPTGYGMPGYTLLGQAVIRLPFIKDTSLGHEILHSWFGNSVFLKDEEGNWCEGLTTYLADQSYADDNGSGTEYRKRQLQRYASYVHSGNSIPLSGFKNAGDNQPLAKKMRAIGYDKGSMFFHMLRNTVGDELFFKCLGEFYTRMRFKHAGWSDIEQIFSQVTGRDLSSFFERWLHGKDIPELEIKQVNRTQTKDGFDLHFQVIQKSEMPYPMTLPVEVDTITDTIRQSVTLTSKETTITLPVDGVPLRLTLDPRNDIMRVLSPDERVPTWAQFLGAEVKKIVLADDSVRDIYAPVLTMLKQRGGEEIAEASLTNQDLQTGSIVFLGTSPRGRTLFSDPVVPGSGFTLDVRKSPFDPDQVIVLMSSSSVDESTKAVRKLRHYGSYGYLHFDNGRLKEKKTVQVSNGLTLLLSEEPSGVAVRQVQGFVDIIDELMKNRVVYVGETHTDYGHHLLQLQVIQSLHKQGKQLAIGMEMFPRHVQPILNDYIQGRIKDEKEFLKKSAYFSGWGYDYRFYRPIINFARKNRIPLVGLNLKKEIVSEIFKKGHTDDLTAEQINQIPRDRDLDLPGYRNRLEKIHAMHGGKMGGPHGQKFSGFIQAQALWDETMAESVANFLKLNSDTSMVVLAGTGHVYKDGGIPPRVARRIDVKQAVVAGIYSGEQGREVGQQLDYLLFTDMETLPPAPKIGVMLKEEAVSENEADSHKTPETRMRVTGISPHGKAGDAGIKEKDIVLKIDGKGVETIDDFKIALFDKKPGDSVTLLVKRENTLLPDEELSLTVELSSMQVKPPGHP